MKSEIKYIIWGALFVIFFAILTSFIAMRSGEAPTDDPEGSWACTADAMECPDGSFVGRVPPYCHFASCPGN